MEAMSPSQAPEPVPPAEPERPPNKHKGRKRTLIRAEAEARRHTVEDLMLQCFSRSEIARRLGVHKNTIQADMDSVRKRWREDFGYRYLDRVNEEAAKLDRDERMLMGFVGRAAQLAKDEKGNPLTGVAAVEDARASAQAAAQAYDRVLRTRERRAKLLGLDKPVRIEAQAQVITGTGARQDTAEEARKALGDPRAVELLMELQDRLSQKTVDAVAVKALPAPTDEVVGSVVKPEEPLQPESQYVDLEV